MSNGNGTMINKAAAFNDLRTLLTKSAPNLKMALPKHLTPDRMIRIALSAASRQPLLLECTPQSVALSLIIAAETGLEPNGYEAHLIPYKNKGRYECQFMPDYKGLVQLAYRSGLVTSFDAAAVHEKDTLEYKLGTDGFINHVPYDGDDSDGALTHAYAIATLKDGGVKFVVLNKRAVARRRASSQAASSSFSPWAKHEDAMWAKSAAKELCKWIPRSPELQRSVEADDQSESGQSQTSHLDGILSLPAPEGDQPEAEPTTQSDALSKRMGKPSKISGQSDITARFDACQDIEACRRLYDECCGPDSTLSQELVDHATARWEMRKAELTGSPVSA